MSKFTKGPWDVRENGGINQAVSAGGDWLIYKCGTDRMSTAKIEANARLIAAAPDLLDALEELERSVIAGSYEDPSHDRIFGALKDARAAIARARGEA